VCRYVRDPSRTGRVARTNTLTRSEMACASVIVGDGRIGSCGEREPVSPACSMRAGAGETACVEVGTAAQQADSALAVDAASLSMHGADPPSGQQSPADIGAEQAIAGAAPAMKASPMASAAAKMRVTRDAPLRAGFESDMRQHRPFHATRQTAARQARGAGRSSRSGHGCRSMNGQGKACCPLDSGLRSTV
jgi:hypothetical protein